MKELNQIIDLCDSMIDCIEKSGNICPRNKEYEDYKRLINRFFDSSTNINNDYGPYQVLSKLYFSGNNYSVCISEAQMIRDTVIWMKHDLFPDCFEKIFISHREKDKDQVAAFLDLLYAIGIPRPTSNDPKSTVFCTSHPSAFIGNGQRNLDTIKQQFQSHEHTFYILWYTDSYFESQACLNEAGAIWAMDKRYQEILSPSFKSERINGLLDKQRVWFRANDKARINDFKEQLEKMFGLAPLTTNAWETARDTYISQIETIDENSQSC